MKIRNKKRAFALAAFLLFALLLAMPVLAVVTDAALTRVEDNAGYFSENQRTALSNRLTALSEKHGCDIVIITCQSVGNKTAELYAADYYETRGYSKDGIVMLISRERDYAFAGKGKGYSALTNDAHDVLNSEVVDELRDDNYYEAVNKFADYCDEFLTAYENGEPYQKPKDVGGRLALAGAAAAGAGGLTGAIGTGSMKSKLKSVVKKEYASDYVKRDSLNIMAANEMYLYSNVVRTPIPRDDERSGGSSGGHSFTSSSGSSWSGSSGKF